MPSAPRPTLAASNRSAGVPSGAVRPPLGRAAEQVTIAAVGQHQLQPGDLGGHAADVTAGAVGAGLGGAGDGLHLDVAHVGQRQAARQQLGVQHVQRAAWPRR